MTITMMTIEAWEVGGIEMTSTSSSTTKLYPTIRISERNQTIIGENCIIGDFVLITVPKLIMGNRSQINAGSKITGRYPAVIGEDVVVGYDVLIITSTDTPDGRFMNDASPLEERCLWEGEVVLEDGCFIGSKSIIFPGVTVGKRSVIGAMSFVRDSVPAGVIGYGQPFHIVKKRG